MQYKKKLSIVFPLLLLITLASCGGPIDVTSNSATGSITLTWTPPSTYSDNVTPLTVAGYKLYYGTAQRSYTTVLDLGNITAYTVSGLTPSETGRYYFAVIAYDAVGNESDYSNEECLML
jgi:hypothetical protein